MKSLAILLLGICALFGATNAQAIAQCQSCLSNNVQCESATTYKVCVNGVTYGGVQNCTEDKFCSTASPPCQPANATNVQFVCGTTNGGGGTGSCNACATGDVFTCVDSTHFTMCNNRDVYVPCQSTGEVCSKELFAITNRICVSGSALAGLQLTASCTNTDTTTTAAPPTTPSLDIARTACVSKKPTTEVRFYFIATPGDVTCTTYIYCEPEGTSVAPTNLKCGTGKLYDNAKQKCVTATTPLGNCTSATT